MMKTMTDQQAYAAMYQFLLGYWERSNFLEVGDLLSIMSLLPDGSPADPAITDDWQQAVEYALQGGKAGSLELG
ncbi:MAG: hypothetical protein JST22_03105 [Bacteroidetes bacterium]|nr:hypothetical protein [Bacteroidota bacterium]